MILISRQCLTVTGIPLRKSPRGAPVPLLPFADLLGIGHRRPPSAPDRKPVLHCPSLSCANTDVPDGMGDLFPARQQRPPGGYHQLVFVNREGVGVGVCITS